MFKATTFCWFGLTSLFFIGLKALLSSELRKSKRRKSLTMTVSLLSDPAFFLVLVLI